MSKIKILHCADLHLGALFSSLSDSGAARRAEILHTLGTVVGLAKSENVDAVLVAGDLFDCTAPDDGTVSAAKAFFASVPEIPVYIVSGNHDYLCKNSPYYSHWSENVHIFSENGYADLKDARIFGIPFKASHESTFSLPKPDADKINILLMHGDTDGGDYNPLSPFALFESGMDYIALGHIHKSGIFSQNGVTYAYPGSPDGLGFDELGEHGVIIAEIGEKSAETRFVPTCSHQYREINADVSSAENDLQILSLIKEKTKDYTFDFLKIILTGKTAFPPDRAFISAGLKDYRFVKIYDRTRPFENLEILSQEASLKGIFVRNVLAVYDSNPAFYDEVLRIGLEALDGREVCPYED